jgi:hypothetical protein
MAVLELRASSRIYPRRTSGLTRPVKPPKKNRVTANAAMR